MASIRGGLGDVAGHGRAGWPLAGEEIDLNVAVAELDALACGYVHAPRPFVRPILWKTFAISSHQRSVRDDGVGVLEF